MEKKELIKALDDFRESYLRLVELFELDDDSVDYLTEDESYYEYSNSFAPLSFDELHICHWCDRIEELLEIRNDN